MGSDAVGNDAMEGSFAARPLPRITPLNRPFWDHAREGRLAMQRCDACGDLHFPPTPVCPNCLATEQSWAVVSGRGTLESWADFHRAYWPGFADALPYRVCLVRLEEGPVLVSNLVGEPGTVRLGQALQVTFRPVNDAVTLPVFAPAP